MSEQCETELMRAWAESVKPHLRDCTTSTAITAAAVLRTLTILTTERTAHAETRAQLEAVRAEVERLRHSVKNLEVAVSYWQEQADSES